MTFFFFFLDQLNLWKFSVWAAAIALYSSYLITFFLGKHFCFDSNFFFWGPSKKIPPKFGEPIRSCLSLTLFVLHFVVISEISEVFDLKEPTAGQNICWWQV
jgi:hypothetical protein